MRTILLLLFTIIITSSCSKSKEDKARDLIGAYISNAIPDNQSYEPIHFDSLQIAKVEYEFTSEYRDNMDSVEMYMRKADEYKGFNKSYDKIYNPQEYKRKMLRMQENTRIAELYLNRIDSLKMNYDENIGGYMMSHRFRYMNPDKGQMDFGDLVFYFNDDVTCVSGIMDFDHPRAKYIQFDEAL